MEVKIDKEKLESTMSREFDAPLEKLWQAHAEHGAIAKWWGSRKSTTEVAEWDFRTGGKWKLVSSEGDQKYTFYGEFKEVVDHDHITWTFNVEGFPADPIVETMSMVELPEGRSKITTLSHYPNMQTLKGMVDSGMEAGARETWDRLAELVEG